MVRRSLKSLSLFHWPCLPDPRPLPPSAPSEDALLDNVIDGVDGRPGPSESEPTLVVIDFFGAIVLYCR